MKYEVKMPQLTETMEYAMILAWNKKVGDYVKKGEVLYEVETDKTTMEIESIDEGYLCETTVELEEEVAPGTVIAVLADSKEECGA
jgi:pyruvate dehydrogenase E2 component (dihydrolipoamide acetyltransferase)